LHEININNLDRKSESVAERNNLKDMAVARSDEPPLIGFISLFDFNQIYRKAAHSMGMEFDIDWKVAPKVEIIVAGISQRDKMIFNLHPLLTVERNGAWYFFVLRRQKDLNLHINAWFLTQNGKHIFDIIMHSAA
jgi:hypothetical protein